tara:strand:- start:1771 stop:3144 length:1374 start_codon:yes stop_codon:yes gene_type:complete
MAFNFKNNNLTIILLLILVIGSSMCYLMMEKSMEGFINGFDSSVTNNFIDLGSLSGKSDRSFLILNDNKRYRFNMGPSNAGIIYDNPIRDSSGEFNFVGKTTIPDLSYNAYLYKDNNTSIDSTTITISYELYNTSLNGTYDFSSIPLGNDYNQDFSGTTNILMVYDQSGYFYDISGLYRRPQFNLILDGKYLISDGRLTGEIPTDRGHSSSTGSNSATGWSGDINFKDMFKGLNNGQLPPNMTPELAAYMLQGSMGSGNQGYAMPYYNSFESAMNNPSNPLVNPTNAMNPLQYNQTLFGPNVSPMMSQNMCKNSSADKSEKVREGDKEESQTKDSTIDSSLGSNNVLNSTFDKLNSSANTILAQNTGDEGNSGLSVSNGSSGSSGLSVSNGSSGLSVSNGSSGSSGSLGSGNPPPCPPCARCPESNYECKKVPAYEQGYENTSLPRPVLSDFSTFGM